MDSLAPLLTVVVTGGFVVGVVFLIRLGMRQQQELQAKREQAWATLAEEFEGEHVEASGPWYRRQPAHLAVQVGGHRVLLDHYVVSTGKTSVTYTRARCEVPTEHRLSVHQQGVLHGLAKALGMQDIPIGDAPYDDAFTIRTDDPAWAQSVLAEPLRAVHLPAPENSLGVQSGTAYATRPGMQTELDGLRLQIGLCAALVHAIESSSS